MGQNNRQRRAAKAKARARARSGGSSHGRATPPRHGFDPWAGLGFEPPGADEDELLGDDPDLLAADELQDAVRYRLRTGAVAPPSVKRLAALPSSSVDHMTEVLLLETIDVLWRSGWQPAEVHRQGRRAASTAAGGRLVAQAIAVDHVGRRSTTLDHRWVSQVQGLDLPPTDGRPGWVRRWVAEERLERQRALTTVIEVLADLFGLPRLDPVLPPPGSSGVGSSRPVSFGAGVAGAEADPVLQRIRALLAQAESTTFEAEAETFTAKAQEMMTRHAVDAAMVAAASGPGPTREPVAVRVAIDPPYADAKSLLLQTVAHATRCRAVYMDSVGMSTLIGFPDDVAAVDLLFTSLLLQAQRALAETAAGAQAGTRTRRSSFRSAFLLAYVARIGDRLDEINAAVYAEAERTEGPAFLPVLRSQEDAVDDFVQERFGDVRTSRVRGGYDSLGWASGQVAADQAKLNAGHLTGRS